MKQRKQRWPKWVYQLIKQQKLDPQTVSIFTQYGMDTFFDKYSVGHHFYNGHFEIKITGHKKKKIRRGLK